MEYLDHLSLFQFLLSPTSIIVIVMTLVCVGMLAIFMPGGLRKVISIVAVFVTAGFAIYFLRKQKNKLITGYNENVKRYLDVIAEKKRIDVENNILRAEIDELGVKATESKEKMNELMKNYEASLKKANENSKQRVELSSEIERHADKLDQGYELGTAAAFRARWENLKAMSDVEQASPQVSQGSIGSLRASGSVPLVSDAAATAHANIDIRFEGYRLKGDVS